MHDKRTGHQKSMEKTSQILGVDVVLHLWAVVSTWFLDALLDALAFLGRS